MLHFVEDHTSAEWLAGRLHPFCTDTGSVIPEGFDDYARIFHPVLTGAGSQRWAEIAERNGRVVHPEMQLHCINRPAGGQRQPGEDEQDGYQPGSLPLEERQHLVELLRTSTTTPDRCWFLVWEGWGHLDRQGIVSRFELPGRAYLFAPGTIDDVVPSVAESPWDQSPSLWWPEDRAWCVATEVDYAWTYVGGSASLIQSILDHDALEGLPAKLHHLPFHDGDRLNLG